MIDPSAVTLDKLADLPANAVIARALNTAGPPASLASSANGQILTRAADTLGWGSLDLGSAAAVSGVLTPDNGGTGLTAYTKGDLVAAANANTLLQLSAGTNGQILRANSASPLGLQWVDGGSHVLYFAQNTGLTVQNTTTESTLVATGAGSPTVAATKLVANDVFRWRIGGYFSSPGTSPGTAIHRLRINGTQILSTNAQNIPTGVSQLHWSIESWITIRTIGSSGQVVGNMLVILVGGTSTTIAPRLWATVPPVTIDMSVSITFDYTIEMSSALVTNIWQSTNGTLERLRVLV
jgi:hypothetical protein